MLKKITINSENRRFNISSIAIGYLDENKVEQIEFEIPQEYQNYGKKACFSANGTTFAKLFDDITSNILIITRDISQYNELDLSIEFFKTENEDEIIARTSILHIVIENAVVCEDVKPDDKKVVILNELIEKVTNLQQETTKNEEIREENEQNRIKNEEERILYYENIKEKVENGDFNGKDALINGVNTLEIVEGDNIHLEQQANVLTISNTYSYDDSQLKADIEKINRDLTNYSLITETGSKVALNINPSTYVMTLELKDKNNNTISSGEVDLPLETMVISATYNNETKEIELTLQNGTKVSFSVADLVSGLVNEDDLNDTLQDYALKMSIPTKLSQLNNDKGYITKSVDNLENYYKKTEIDTKVQAINTTTNGLNTRLTKAEKNIETNKTDIKDLSNRTKRIETDIFDSGEANGTGINLQDSTLAEFQEVKIDGVGNQDTSKMIYVCNGSETGSYYFTYNSTNYQFTMPTIANGSILVFDTNTLKLSLNNEEITTTNESTSTLINLESTPNPDYKQPIEVITEDFDLVSCGTNLVNWGNVRQGSFGAIGKYENDVLTVTSENPQTYPAIAYDITDILKRYENKKLKFICEDSYVSNEEASANVQTTVITNDGKAQYLPLYNIQAKNNIPQTILPNIKSAKIGVYANNSTTPVANTSTIVKPMLFIYDGEDENIESYTETRQTITMPDGEFAGKIDDTYKDQFRINYNEQDGKYHLYLDKVVGKVVLDGSESSWEYLNGVFYLSSITDYKTFNNIPYSSHFKGIINVTSIYDMTIKENKTCSFLSSRTPNARFYIKYTEIGTTTELKKWLASNNVEVYYVLAEPYTLDLGVVNMPLSYYPITNVYNTCEAIPNMYVKYYRDFKKTVTTMQVDINELKSTIQELTNNQANLLSQINTIKENQVVEEESEVVTQ